MHLALHLVLVLVLHLGGWHIHLVITNRRADHLVDGHDKLAGVSIGLHELGYHVEGLGMAGHGSKESLKHALPLHLKDDVLNVAAVSLAYGYGLFDRLVGLGRALDSGQTALTNLAGELGEAEPLRLVDPLLSLQWIVPKIFCRLADLTRLAVVKLAAKTVHQLALVGVCGVLPALVGRHLATLGRSAGVLWLLPKLRRIFPGAVVVGHKRSLRLLRLLVLLYILVK